MYYPIPCVPYVGYPMSATQFSLFLPQVPNGYYLPNTPCGNLQRRGRGNCISPAHCKGSLLAIVTNCCPPIVLLQRSTPQPLNPSNPWVGHTCLLLFEKLTFNALAYFQGTEHISLFGTAKGYDYENYLP